MLPKNHSSGWKKRLLRVCASCCGRTIPLLDIFSSTDSIATRGWRHHLLLLLQAGTKNLTYADKFLISWNIKSIIKAAEARRCFLNKTSLYIYIENLQKCLIFFKVLLAFFYIFTYIILGDLWGWIKALHSLNKQNLKPYSTIFYS